MPSSSKHDTAVEKHIQSLCLLVYARLSAAKQPIASLADVMFEFLSTLDLEPNWLHSVFDEDLHTTTTIQTPDEAETAQVEREDGGRMEDARRLRRELRIFEEQGQQMSRSALLADVANACIEVARLLNGIDRGREANIWAIFASECQKNSNELQQEEESCARLRNLQL